MKDKNNLIEELDAINLALQKSVIKEPFAKLIEQIENRSIHKILLLPSRDNQDENWLSKKMLESLYDKLKDGCSFVCLMNEKDSTNELQSNALRSGFCVYASTTDHTFIMRKNQRKLTLIKKSEEKRTLILHESYAFFCEL